MPFSFKEVVQISCRLPSSRCFDLSIQSCIFEFKNVVCLQGHLYQWKFNFSSKILLTLHKSWLCIRLNLESKKALIFSHCSPCQLCLSIAGYESIFSLEVEVIMPMSSMSQILCKLISMIIINLTKKSPNLYDMLALGIPDPSLATFPLNYFACNLPSPYSLCYLPCQGPDPPQSHSAK